MGYLLEEILAYITTKNLPFPEGFLLVVAVLINLFPLEIDYYDV